MSYKKFVLVPYTNYQRMVEHKCAEGVSVTNVNASRANDSVDTKPEIIHSAHVINTTHNTPKHTSIDTVIPHHAHVSDTPQLGVDTHKANTGTHPAVSVVKKTKQQPRIKKTKQNKPNKRNGMSPNYKVKTKFNWLSI